MRRPGRALMAETFPPRGDDPRFPPTSWSLIRHAQDPGAPEYSRHLQRLISIYWKPIYWVIRRSWPRSAEEAADLTQEFFATNVLGRSLLRGSSPDQGSFRSLLRVAVRNFMAQVVRDAGRQKRGGGQVVPIDPARLEALESEADEGQADSPEATFDLAWKQVVLARALELTRAELASQGKSSHFELFRGYELEEGRARASYAEVGAPLGLSAAQVKHALVQTRALFKEMVTDVVREYVDGPDELAVELRSLFRG